jgi:hypothetical protein
MKYHSLPTITTTTITTYILTCNTSSKAPSPLHFDPLPATRTVRP